MIIKFYTLNHPITNEIRYIGRTKNSLASRLSDHCCESRSNHNTYKKNWIKSMKRQGIKPTINLIKKVDTSWEDSHIIERSIIEEHFKIGVRLVNLVDKGCGSHGIKVNRDHTGKPILQYDLEGKFIAEWKTMTLAAKHLGIGVKQVSRGIKRKSSSGFQWRLKSEGYPLDIGDIRSKRISKSKKVIKYSLGGSLLDIYDTTIEAAIGLGKHSVIVNAINNAPRKTALGFQWRYFTEDYRNKIESISLPKKSVKCSAGDKEFSFESLAEAADEFNVSYVTIRNWCVKNSNKRGYIWSFN